MSFKNFNIFLGGVLIFVGSLLYNRHMKKLTKLNNAIYQMGLTKAERADFKELDNYLEGFFPEAADVANQLQSFCDNDIIKALKLRLEEKNNFNTSNMLVHSNDNQWLADCFQNYILKQDMFKIQPVEKTTNSSLVVKKYVNLSPKFKAKREEYARNIVKSYISNWTVGGCMDDFYCKRERKVELLHSKNFDKEIRNQFVLAMEFLNVNKKSIEAGIEGMADYWLEDSMKIAFKNHMRKMFGKNYNFDNISPSFKRYENNWLAVRKREYFDEHRLSVKRYGRPNKDMKMNNADLKVVRDEIEFWEDLHEMENHGVEPILNAM